VLHIVGQDDTPVSMEDINRLKSWVVCTLFVKPIKEIDVKHVFGFARGASTLAHGVPLPHV